MKIIIPEIPPSLNKYAGRANAWDYRAEKQRWLQLFTAYCPKCKPLDKAVVTITYYFPYGIKRDPNRPCKRCGGPIGSTNTRQLYCKDCQKAMDTIRARKSSMKKAEPKKCEYCGKDFFGQPGQKYCSKQCYKDAVVSGKYKRPKNWLKRRDGKIDIEIRVCGKTTERRERVDYYEAREIWHLGWIGQGYAALVTVDGHRLETLPQIKTFFGFRRDSL